MELLIVTGMSGAGKTRALQTLEDMRYFCIDNLPPQLVLYLLDSEMAEGILREKTAVTVDIRSASLFKGLDSLIRGLEQKSIHTTILYLDASDEVLRNRYKESRRVHPLIARGEALDLTEALEMERDKLSDLRQLADIVMDTSHLTTGEFRQKMARIFGGDSHVIMSIEFVAFGYKYGILADADLVFDVRCLPNPYYEEELRNLTGEDQAVRSYVLGSPEGQQLYRMIEGLLEYSIPLYIKEGKTRLVIGIGCTGGQHRSLAFALALKEHFEQHYRGVRLTKRDTAENRYEIYSRGRNPLSREEKEKLPGLEEV